MPPSPASDVSCWITLVGLWTVWGFRKGWIVKWHLASPFFFMCCWFTMWEEVKSPRKQQSNPKILNNKQNTDRTGRKSLLYTKPEGRLRKIHSPNYKECEAITEIWFFSRPFNIKHPFQSECLCHWNFIFYIYKLIKANSLNCVISS